MIQIPTAGFDEALTRVKPVITATGPTSGVLLSTMGTEALFAADNFDVRLTQTVPMPPMGDQAVRQILNFPEVRRFVSQAKKDKVELIGLEVDDRRTTLTAGGFEYTTTGPHGQFPDAIEFKKPQKVSLDLIALYDAHTVAAKDQTRPTLCCVYVEPTLEANSDGSTFEGNTTIYVSTDSYRLNRLISPVRISKRKTNPPMLLPGHVIGELRRHTGKLTAGGIVDGEWTPLGTRPQTDSTKAKEAPALRIGFDDGFSICAFLSDGAFPNYRGFFGVEFEVEMSFNREEMRAALKRLLSLKIDGPPLKIDNSDTPGKIKLAMTTERTEALVTVPGALPPGHGPIGYNLKFLADALLDSPDHKGIETETFHLHTAREKEGLLSDVCAVSETTEDRRFLERDYLVMAIKIA